MSLLKPGVSCAEVTDKINTFFAERDLLQYRTFGYGHSFGVLSHYYGREAGLELREDVDTVLEAGMVISMEPMLTIERCSYHALPGQWIGHIDGAVSGHRRVRGARVLTLNGAPR